jgi:transcription antitermination factor NusG
VSWYVLYTASRAEIQVEKRLKVREIETFLPLHLTPRRWSDRIKMVEVPLFNSYIFVKTSDEVLRELTKVPGISRIVYYNRQPAVVREIEIEAIKNFLANAKGKECEFVENEEVLISEGPMKDVKAKIKKISGEYLFLKLEQIGVTVKIKSEQVIRKQKVQ